MIERIPKHILLLIIFACGFIIDRYQYTVLGYSYLGNHLINVDFRKPLKELEQMSDEELKAVAKEILIGSIIFGEL